MKIKINQKNYYELMIIIKNNLENLGENLDEQTKISLYHSVDQLAELLMLIEPEKEDEK